MTAPAGERRVEYMRLSEISRAPRNPKQHAGEEIRASLGRFGIADLPVLDERTGQLVSGHGRLDQIHHLAGLTSDELSTYVGRPGLPNGVQVDPVTGEWLVPVVRGWASIDDAEAEAYLVTANSLTMFGGWDDAALAQILADLAEQDPELALLTGFDDGDLERLLAAQEVPDLDSFKTFDADDEPGGDDETLAAAKSITCPACGLNFAPS